MKTINKISLAIALIFLRMPAIWTVILFYCLSQIMLLYFQVSIPFLSLNSVEAAGLSPEDLVRQDRIIPSAMDKDGSNLDPKVVTVTVKAETDTITVANTALTAASKFIDSYVPVVTGGIVAAGVAAMTKSLPPHQRLVGMVAAGSLTSGTMLTSQWLRHAYKNPSIVENPDTKNKAVSEAIKSLEAKPDWNKNSNIQDIDMSDSYFINAPLEGYGDLSMIAFGLWMMSYGVMLAVILIVVNTIITQLKLETHKFVTDRPFLLKLFNLSSKGRNAVTYSMMFVALLGSCAMYYYLEMFIDLLKTLNL